MVQEILVDKQIEAGRVLTDRLDKAGFPVTASFWLYDSEENEWRMTYRTGRRRSARCGGRVRLQGSVVYRDRLFSN
jgi:hypothetical protein